MALTENDIVVAIEIGSSRISGIAGKKKDGTMQILAYAAEKNKEYIKRGVIWNIEKTYQCINNIVAKLEATLKTRIKYAYVGLSGQSMRSYHCATKRNLLTQSCITKEIVDSMCLEGREIPFNDYEVLETFPQEYLIDQNINNDPVGVMGTNVECEYINIIAKNAVRANLNNAFANSNVSIRNSIDLIAPLQLADNVLTDTEKRSGCVLVDLGADTTTVIVFKNNIVRYLVTLPLGSNNINKDLATLQMDETETENVKLKYSNAFPQDAAQTDNGEPEYFTSADGHKIEVSKIQSVIEARITEIIANVTAQIANSNYKDKLLAGIILTGGGSNMKNIDKAFLNSTNAEKVRIAKKINAAVVKAGTASNLTLDDGRSNTLVSLLLAGNMPCDDGKYDANDLFDNQQHNEEQNARRKEDLEKQEAERQAASTLDGIKTEIRKTIDKVADMNRELERHGKDKSTRNEVRMFINSAMDCVGEKSGYDDCINKLNGDKYKQTVKEAEDLLNILHTRLDELADKYNEVAKANTFLNKIKTIIDDLLDDKN